MDGFEEAAAAAAVAEKRQVLDCLQFKFRYFGCTLLFCW